MTATSRPVRLAALFDTSFGFGTPQVELFMESLSQYFQADECWMIEPDVKGKPALRSNAHFNYVRVATRFPPHFDVFQIEYNMWLKDFLSETPPDVVVITSANLLPGLLRSTCKPKMIIYYMLENLDYQRSIGGWDVTILHQMAHDRIDLVCVPESSRASFDIKWLQWASLPVVEILNVSSDSFHAPPDRRDFKVVNAGSICERTLSHYLASPSFDAVPMDIYGIPSSPELRRLFSEGRNRQSCVSYKGAISMEDLDAIYGQYSYSLVMWAPTNINQIFASPNKFFQSIAHGVPPITAPHPQCVSYIRKYGCGIVADDWREGSILSALKQARNMFGTEPYFEMVKGCEVAVANELNWSDQFRKVVPFLPSTL